MAISNLDNVEKANDFRARIRAGEEVSKEELAKVFRALRSDRANAATVTEKKKEKAAPIDLNSLFGTPTENKI